MQTQRKLVLPTLGLFGVVLLITYGAEKTFGNELEDTKSELALNFAGFKSKFRIEYADAVEEMSRNSIYFLRVIQVFLYSILYRTEKSKSYLVINQFSDRTQKELWSIIISGTPLEIDNDRLPVNADGFGREIEILRVHNDESQLKERLAEVLNFNEFAKPRKRRDVNSDSENEDKVPKRSGAKLMSSVTNSISKIKILKFKPKKTGRELASPRIDELFIDHRESGCFFKPRDQGYCSCSYAFASISFYEWAHCKATSKLVGFSEQYIVDCGSRVSSSFKGCRGGSLKNVGKFVDEFGLESQVNYPYAGKQLECPHDKQTGHEQMGFIKVKNLEVEEFSSDMIEEILKNSPVLINMKVNRLFFHYGGGVDSGEGCRDTEGFHSALIVGSGRQNGQFYWLIRNSFSDNWGINGYYKLNKSSDCLAITAKQGYLLRPQFDSNEEKNINQNYDGYEIRKRQEQIVASFRPVKGKKGSKQDDKRWKPGIDILGNVVHL